MKLAQTPLRWDNRALFRLLWPLVIEQLLAVTMGAADTIMVSSVGEHAVSGVNIIDNINNLLIIAFGALCTGGSVVVSQYIGRQDANSSRLASKQLIYGVTAMSLLILAVAAPLRAPIIRLIYGKVAPDVMEAATVYFLITAISYPMLAVYNACAALFRAAGDSKTPMRIALLVNVLNIGGNAVFIFVLRIGVVGAALSTLISRTAAAAALITLLVVNKTSPISLAGLHRVTVLPRMIRSIMNVGIPSGLESSMFQIGRLATQRIFTTFGTAAIAANAIASVINSFSFMPGQAYGFALLTVVGQCVGAGDYVQAKSQTAKIIKATYVTLFIICAGIYLFMDPLVGLFNLNPSSQEMAKAYLRIHCISMAIGWPCSFALPNALRAAGDSRFVMWAATISMWVVRVSGAYLLTYTLGFGPLGVWLGMGADFICRGTCYLTRWHGGKWQKMKVIE
jgi:putative MATE family efflux protein